MREPVSFFVEGTPKGQPRGRACIRGQRAGIYDPGTADGWKAAVAEVWRNVARSPAAFETAVHVRLQFYFARPASHFGSGKNAGVLKSSAPAAHMSSPDVDNLAKAVLDVLTRLKAWHDDRQVSRLDVSRHWSPTQTPGCMVILKEDAPGNPLSRGERALPAQTGTRAKKPLNNETETPGVLSGTRGNSPAITP